MKAPSEETKNKQKRGMGEGADYTPWIKTREINSIGTATIFNDWLNGRSVHLLSQGELDLYCILRWNEHVTDIREQFPLELEKTTAIARELNIRPVNNAKTHMTTDMLVTMDNGTKVAYSYKTKKEEVYGSGKQAARTAEKLLIEKQYWSRQGVKWKLVFRENIDHLTALNIRDVVRYYDPLSVHDPFSKIRHLIAHHKIVVDMSKPIDYQKLLKETT